MNGESDEEWAYAPVGTLEGLLQRGRGLGALSAPGDTTAGMLVYNCVRRDCRWDSQVDERHLYLARLIRGLELSLEPVFALLAGDEEDCERATRVLELLALSGAVEARQALRSYVREGAHWEARDWCGPDRLAVGVARFGPQAAEAVPLLRRFWLRTPHSYERTAYLKALAVIDPAGLEQAYTESLWDCESDARLLGIASAPDMPLVRDRLAQLRDDPMEEPDVRSAARVRLAALDE